MLWIFSPSLCLSCWDPPSLNIFRHGFTMVQFGLVLNQTNRNLKLGLFCFQSETKTGFHINESSWALTKWLKSEIVHKPYLTKSDYIWVRLSKTKRNLVKAFDK